MTVLQKSRGQAIVKSICPVCQGLQAQSLYVYSYDTKPSHILECSQCAHRWITPNPLQDLHSRQMDSVVDGELFDNRILRWLHKQYVVLPEIRYVRKLKGMGKIKLLDIACGTGWATSLWQAENFQVTGLEASAIRSQICRDKYGIKVFTGFLEEFEPKEKFDVITMRHILEHIEDPIVSLERVKTLLSEDGLLIITVPNTNAIGRYLFGRHYAWILPWHLHFYYPKTLKALVARVGLKEMGFYQRPSPLWYPDSLWSCLNWNKEYRKPRSKVAMVLWMLLFSPIVLLGWVLNLSDNLTIFASKAK